MSFLVAIAAAICVDARRRKRSETRLAHHVAALESANRALEDSHDRIAAAARAKGEFLANMSHEIRTPMTAILGYADELANSVQGCDQQEATQTIKRNGDHLLSIINDILDLSKIEAGELRVDLVPTSAVAVFSDVVSLMRVRAEAKSLTLTLDFCGPMRKCLDVGCDDYLTKPIARETFLATVAAWADRALARTGTPSAVARQPRDQ